MDIDIYDYLYWGDYNKKISDLADMAISENWNYSNKNDFGILKNYMRYTFKKLQEENKIYESENYCVFNTGLFTPYYEQIYVLGEKNIVTNQDLNVAKWRFKSFCTKYDLGYTDVNQNPERADYFSDPGLLVFDWHYDVNINYRHILEDEDNRLRLPDSVLKAKRPQRELEGAVNDSIKKVMANYKLAVPQYYNGKIQLLLPLYFEEDDVPNLALAITKMNGNYYQGHTCLTIDMAYSNARLISKPENNWLLL